MRTQLVRIGKCLRGVPGTLAYSIRRPIGGHAENGDLRFDIQENLYSRYLYSFFKFFDIEGYGIRMRARPATVYSIGHAQYGNMLLSQRMLKLEWAKSGVPFLGDKEGEKRLRPIDFLKPDDGSVYDVPMAQHPMMYSTGHWNFKIEAGKSRSKGLLFVGNSDASVYSKIAGDDAFNVVDRVTLWNSLIRREDSVEVGNENRGNCGVSNNVVVMDSRRTQVPFEEFRSFVAGFGFFLCAPGVFMPLCHNLIEVLSVGTVPLIQKSYSQLLSPPLEDGVNAVLFDGLEDFDQAVDRCLAFNPDEVARLCAGATEYYERHLTPGAVVRRVLDPQVRTVRILAGEKSVELLRGRKATI